MTIDCAKAGTPSLASTFEADGSDAPLTKRRKAGLAAEQQGCPGDRKARNSTDGRRSRPQRGARTTWSGARSRKPWSLLRDRGFEYRSSGEAPTNLELGLRPTRLEKTKACRIHPD
jgi:hypothetical protein